MFQNLKSSIETFYFRKYIDFEAFDTYKRIYVMFVSYETFLFKVNTNPSPFKNYNIK